MHVGIVKPLETNIIVLDTCVECINVVFTIIFLRISKARYS